MHGRIVCVVLGLGFVVAVAAGRSFSPLAFGPDGREAASAGFEEAIPPGPIDPDQLREYHDLTARQHAVTWRNARKKELAAALIRGETTFADAAARFEEINRDDPAAMTGLRNRYPEATDEELHFRNVIGFVRGHVRMEPDRVPGLVDRLESEVRRRFPSTATAGEPAA